MKNNILVADDEYGIREFLYELFKDDYTVFLAEDGNRAISALEKESPDVALIDMRMPGISGQDVLTHIQKSGMKTIPIVITADRDLDHAVEAMKLGAYDYVVKPVDYNKLKIIVRNAIEKKELSEKLDILEKEIKGNFAFPNIIGQKSKAMQAVLSRLENVLNNDSTVLIYGESGTGKEMIARAIHYNGNRADKPFIPVDCAAIPESLIETELFGYEKGAFTGAAKTTKGKFELANSGTLFLDEISNITVEVQAKLLRVLQEKEFLRIGGDKKISVDVRIVTASNRDLKQLIEQGKFREDLYYRLNVIPLHIPPLRERQEDISELVGYFLQRFNHQFKKKVKIEAETLNFLIQYQWPGNVRELENLMNRLVLTANSNIIVADDLPEEIRNKKVVVCDPDQVLNSDMSLEQLEELYIASLMERHKNNVSNVAQILGITRKTLYSKMEKYDLKKD